GVVQVVDLGSVNETPFRGVKSARHGLSAAWARCLGHAARVRDAAMPTSKVDLTNAISRVAKGDRSAFEALYAATSAKLFGVVVRILVRRDLAEEVLQEVYLRVWQRA